MSSIRHSISLVACCFALGSEVLAAAFINLGFDTPAFPDWVPPRIPGSPFASSPGEWVRPGWNTGPQNQSAVGYNYSQRFSGWASLLDRDFRDSHFGSNARVPVVGNYSLGIWPLSLTVTGGVYDPYVLWQTGDIPADARSLQFLHQGPLNHGDDLQVFVGGELRSLVALPDVPTGDPEIPLFRYLAVDVSPFAGQTVELRFEFRSRGYDDFGDFPRLPGQPNAQSHILDDLSFSPLPAVPEPATWALLGLGAAALGWALRRRH